jgi:hypothetical protein
LFGRIGRGWLCRAGLQDNRGKGRGPRDDTKPDEPSPELPAPPDPSPSEHDENPQPGPDYVPKDIPLPAVGEVWNRDFCCGWLWKPISEHNHGLVFLAKSDYTGHIDFIDVRRKDKSGKMIVIQRLEYFGVYNGWREHHRTRSPIRKGADFTPIVDGVRRPVWVKVHLKNAGAIRFSVTDGSIRNE